MYYRTEKASEDDDDEKIFLVEAVVRHVHLQVFSKKFRSSVTQPRRIFNSIGFLMTDFDSNPARMKVSPKWRANLVV